MHYVRAYIARPQLNRNSVDARAVTQEFRERIQSMKGTRSIVKEEELTLPTQHSGWKTSPQFGDPRWGKRKHHPVLGYDAATASGRRVSGAGRPYDRRRGC